MVDPAHTPLFELDQMAANLLAPEAQAKVSEHLTKCSSCTARLDEIRSDQQAELFAHPPAAFAAKLLAGQKPARRPLFNWMTAMVPLGAAAVLAIVLLKPPTDATDPILFKGTAELIVQAERPGVDALERIRSSADLPAGTKLRLSVIPGAFRRVTIFAVDAEGKVQRVAGIDASTETKIPVGLSVDDEAGSDRIVAVFSDASVADEALIKALKQAFEEHGDVENMTPRLTGMYIDSVLIRKLGTPE